MDMNDYIKNYILSTKDFINWTRKALILESESNQAVKAEGRQAVKSLFKNIKVHTFEESICHLFIFSIREELIILVKEFLNNKKKPD